MESWASCRITHCCVFQPCGVLKFQNAQAHFSSAIHDPSTKHHVSICPRDFIMAVLTDFSKPNKGFTHDPEQRTEDQFGSLKA